MLGLRTPMLPPRGLFPQVSSISDMRWKQRRSMKNESTRALVRVICSMMIFVAVIPNPCQTSKTRVRAQLDIRTERLAHTHVVSRQGARSASEMQSCWLDKPDPRAARSLRFSPSENGFARTLSSQQDCISLALRAP